MDNMDDYLKYNFFMFKPLLAEEVKKTGEPIKDLYTKEQITKIAIRILERETEVLKAKGYKLIKI